MSSLAIFGGDKVRKTPFPPRRNVGLEEKKAVDALFDRVINEDYVINYNGEYETQYENDFVKFMGGGYADGVNSGTNSVFVALGALNLEPFSEVIVPPITDPGGCMPVIFNACVPVFADSDRRTFNITAEAIEARITERTRAVVVAHIFGEPADMDPIMQVARKHNLYVVEDCAQAHGARYKGRLVGSLGDIAAFSTMSGKHHCTGGQGGVVYTNNEKLHFEGRRFADRGKPFGMPGEVSNVRAGLNCNLNDLSAVFGIEQIKKLPRIVESRNRIGEQIKEALKGNPCVNVGWQLDDCFCSYWFLRLTLNLENLKCGMPEFTSALIAEGILAAPDYRHIQCERKWFTEQATFGKFGFPWQCAEYKGDKHPVYDLPNADYACKRNFNVVINESFTDDDAADIVRAVEKVADYYAK